MKRSETKKAVGQKSAAELKDELNALLKEQFGLRMQLATQALTKHSEIERVRRQIARVHTFLAEKKAKGSAK